MKQNFFVTFRILIFITCLTLCAFFAVFAVNKRKLSLVFTPKYSAESTKDVANPYRGFYEMVGYTLTDDVTAVRTWCDGLSLQSDTNLFLLEVNLLNYRDKDLSANALSGLKLLLSNFRNADKQLILRFLYDWNGTALQSEPDNIKQIISHMKQTADIVNEYKNNIFTMQGIFTGNCGEMNGSNYMSEDDITELMYTLHEVIDPSIYLSVRTPAQLRGIVKSFRPLAYCDPHSGQLGARLGLFNDGMLGSVYDLGTYDDTPFEGIDKYFAAGTREEELEYQNSLCRYVPNGGEAVVANEYNDIDNAVRDLNTMHISYLNNAHDPAVLEKWKSSIYNDINGYEYIAAHLGYRYVITDCKIDFHSFLDTTATLNFTVTNTGFAPAYRKFSTKLIVKNIETNEENIIDVSFNNLGLQSQSSMVLSTELSVRSFAKGTYELSVKMNDDTLSTPVIFANENSNDTTKLGELTIY